MRCALSATFVAFAVLTFGCSKSEDTPVAAAPVAPPDATAREFLEAIRVGDDKKAESLLTDLAREKTAQMDLMVAPPGSPSASYQVGEMEIIEGKVAHVSTIWTDTGDNGKPQSNEFVWALRLGPQGWRVAGVAVALFPNQPPLLLDFEDPADMMRKQQMAEQEMQRQMNPQQTNPQNVQAGGPMTAGATQPGQVQPAGATGPAPANLGAPGMLPGAAPGQVAPVGMSAPGVYSTGPDASAIPFNPNAPAPGGFAPPSGTLPPSPVPGTPAVGGQQNPPTNLPPVGPYAPVSPSPLPPTPGTPVPLQAEQPQPGTLPPR
jgi:hypothetical protein